MSDTPPPPPFGSPPPPPPPPAGQQPPQGGDWQSSGNPKADAKAAKAYAKASRPLWKKKRFWVIGLIIVVIAGAAASGGGGNDKGKSKNTATAPSDQGKKTSGQKLAESSGSKNDPVDDVAIDSCTRDSVLGGAEAGLTVTNHSADPSNYVIEIKVQSPDAKTSYDTATAIVSRLDNGQNQKEKASSLNKIPDGAEFECVIGDVTRYAS